MKLDTGTAAAIVLLLGGIASAVGVIVNALTKAKLQLMDASERRQEINAGKLDAIEAKVNGGASVSAAKIERLHGDVAAAKRMIADLHQTAAVTAAKAEHGDDH